MQTRLSIHAHSFPQMGMSLMKKGIAKRANFDIAQCAPIKFVSAAFVPALFVHGDEDDFIVPRHSQVRWRCCVCVLLTAAAHARA